MAFVQGDVSNPSNSDTITTFTDAVTGGTLYLSVLRSPNGGYVGAAQSFVPNTASLPDAQYSTIAVTTGTLAAGNASGARMTYLYSTGATPGSQAMRTPAQILADTPGLVIGGSYTLRVLNTGAGTFTLATDSGTGFTLTGTMTVAQNVFRDYIVTLVTGTTGTIKEVGNGTIS